MLSTTPALNGWHPGERAVQDMMRLPQLAPLGAVVKALPLQHSLFYSTRLHFLPVTTLDEQGRPWGSVLTAPDGTIGFIRSPDETKLIIDAGLVPGDPIGRNLSDVSTRGKLLISGVGVETTTRRRNKFAGAVERAAVCNKDLHAEIRVNEALGQCPKYITVRALVPYAGTLPHIRYDRRAMAADERLPDDVIVYIQRADSTYLATSYVASAEDERMYPSYVGTSHRGGRPGFIRVRPNDGRTIVLPNYSGNRLMNSLGNIYITPLAGLVFPSFTTGSILHVTGNAAILFGEPAQRVMPGCNVLTTITVTGYVFVKDALPLREAPGSEEQRPYGPPIRYLAEERPPAVKEEEATLALVSSVVHNSTLATFTFEAPMPLTIHPAQSAIFDLSEFIRRQARTLIDWVDDPRRENDDCVRTWTVSLPTTPDAPRTFSITVREHPDGLVTSTLFKVARRALQGKKTGFVEFRPMNLAVKLRALGLDSYSLEPVAACDGGRRLLWAGGGIGITPFMNLANHVAGLVRKSYGLWNIVPVVSTREPDVILDLMWAALSPLHGMARPEGFILAIHVFSHAAVTSHTLPTWIRVHEHVGRVQDSPRFFETVQASKRACHICGPLPFIRSVVTILQSAGVDPESVRREYFTY